jgi:hypothetical protein
MVNRPFVKTFDMVLYTITVFYLIISSVTHAKFMVSK